MTKRLYRSRENKVIGGVCAGIAEYFDIDPVVIRIICVISFFVGGFGFMAYLIAWIIIPLREYGYTEFEEVDSENKNADPFEKDNSSSSTWRTYLPGLLLVALGVMLLVRENMHWFDWGEMFPLMLVIIGIAIIFKKSSPLKPAQPADPAEPIKRNGENGKDVSHNGGTL